MRLALLETTFLLSRDFHEIWLCVMSICLFTGVKGQWATLVLGWVIVSVLDKLSDVSELGFLSVATLINPSVLLMSLMAVQLAHVD